VVAFLQSSLPTLPITITLAGAAPVYVAGMPPNTTYKVTVGSTAVTIAADDGTHQLTSSAAGVLGILHRSSVE
jgi:hypothetical protein